MNSFTIESQLNSNHKHAVWIFRRNSRNISSDRTCSVTARNSTKQGKHLVCDTVVSFAVKPNNLSKGHWISPCVCVCVCVNRVSLELHAASRWMSRWSAASVRHWQASCPQYALCQIEWTFMQRCWNFKRFMKASQFIWRYV